MNYRTYKLMARKNYTADYTEVIDLDVTDPISSLVIDLEQVNASATMSAHFIASIEKMEIVDGSEVLYSLDGYKAYAVDWYANKGRFRSPWDYAINGGTANHSIGINFGRWPWDTDLAFDPKKHTNPQLRITLNIDGGGMSCASLYLTVWANMFDQKIISPRGFLMTKEVKSWTGSSSVHEYTDLPRDFAYRNIYLRSFTLGTEPDQLLSNIKLSEDNDKRIPYDCPPVNITRNLLHKYPLVTEQFYFTDDAASRYIYCSASERVIGNINGWAAAAGGYSHSFYDGDGGRAKIIAETAGANVNVNIIGVTPCETYEIPCGTPDDIADWWNVQQLGSLKADITGAAAAANSIAVQQLRLY
jgi:hypothetical protein